MKNLRFSIYILIATIGCLILYSCASIGNPTGGPRDEEPPLFVKSNPTLGATNVSRQKIELEFNEIVNVKDAFSKVVVSPTSKSVPRVSSLGKKVTVDFTDSLVPNTTYTIDFANSIEDNNEGNKLNGFAFWFSTGEVIDTLQISGMVLAADNLEPQQGIIVGVHSNFDDTVFRNNRLERVAKTDDRGRFVIRNLKPGKYRVFALNDLNNDFRWDNPAEDIAFFDTIISPTSEQTTTTDTIYDLINEKIDTIITRNRTRFLPNNILLNSFNIGYKAQYLVKDQRIDSTRISLIFNAPSDTLPTLKIVGNPELTNWYRLQRTADNDSLTYWLKPDIVSVDSLLISVDYIATDSAQQLSWRTDTLKMFTQRPKSKPKKKKKEDNDTTIPEMKFLDMKISSGSTHDVYRPIILTTNEPIDSINQLGFHLEEKQDTLWVDSDSIRLLPLDSISLTTFKIEHNWKFGTEYKLTIDSISVIGMYGLFNKPITHSFTVKKEEDYSNLYFIIEGLADSIPAFVELLNSSDSPIRRARVENGEAAFLYLEAGSYYARIIEDRNGNGIYDVGNYDEWRQPEFVCYYPKKINLKKNWDISQSWNIYEVALDLQKPDALKKNKPDTPKNQRNKRNNEEEEEEDEYFDVNENPFDPNSKRRKNQTSSYR